MTGSIAIILLAFLEGLNDKLKHVLLIICLGRPVRCALAERGSQAIRCATFGQFYT